MSGIQIGVRPTRHNCRFSEQKLLSAKHHSLLLGLSNNNMAMVGVVNWQSTGGLMVQADRLGPKVGGHLAPCWTHRV